MKYNKYITTIAVLALLGAKAEVQSQNTHENKSLIETAKEHDDLSEGDNQLFDLEHQGKQKPVDAKNVDIDDEITSLSTLSAAKKEIETKTVNDEKQKEGLKGKVMT